MKRLLQICAFFVCLFVLTSSNTNELLANDGVITLTRSNVISLTEEVSEESVDRVIGQMLSNPNNKLYLYINSPGGSIDAGIRLRNAMSGSGKQITCIAQYAASMAFSLFEHCSVRVTLPQSIIMQHQASYMSDGKVSEHETQLTTIKKLVNELDVEAAKRLGITLEDFDAKVKNDWWLIGEEIVTLKAADKQMNITCAPSLVSSTRTQTFASPLGMAVVTWSNCPLILTPIDVKLSAHKGADPKAFSEWTASLHLSSDYGSKRIVIRSVK